jgi:hypothetical protein
LKVKKRSLLIIVVMLSVFLIGIGSANAVWRIGGTGPFLNYPFYIDGAADGVNFKTFLVVNNMDHGLGVPFVAAVHYVTSDGNGDTNVGRFDDLAYDDVTSEFVLHDDSLTPQESRIFIPGTSNPALGSEVEPFQSSAFNVGWVEMWAYDASPLIALPHPPSCFGRLRGEAITVDLQFGSAWTYKAVASILDPNGATSDMWSVAAPTNTSVPQACISGNTWDVWWKTNPSWDSQFLVPTGYNRLASKYDLDLWVKAPPGGDTDNNTILIMTNPNNRKKANSDNTCRDCTSVTIHTFDANEVSQPLQVGLCEMRTVSIRDDFPPTLAYGDVFYGFAELLESDDNIDDTQAGNGCSKNYPGFTQWLFPTPGPTSPNIPGANLHGVCCHAGTGAGNAGSPCLPDGPQSICGLINSGDLSQGCKACDILDNTVLNRSQGFLAVAYTAWRGTPGGLTYWGNNLFNNCGDATAWNLFGGAVQQGLISLVNDCP